MKIIKSREWVLPLLTIAFTGAAVSYVNLIFSTSARWAVLALAIVFVMSSRMIVPIFSTLFMRASLVFAAWALLTSLWSEAPELSLMKSVALALAILGGAGGGYLWVRFHPIEAALDALLPMSLMVLGAGVFGLDMIQNTQAPEGPTLYQGLTGNSNMFGTLCAMAFPFFAWKYSCATSSRKRYYWGAVTLVLIMLVLLSVSRAAIGVVIFAGLGLFGAQGARKILPKAILALVALGIFTLTMPDVAKSLETRFIYKSREGSITSSRDQEWVASYEQSLKGGWVGGGYGVTIGSGQSFGGGLNAIGYGREKANSQLGIMEELGFVGLLIYIFGTLGLFATLWRAKRRCRDPQARKLLGLMMGLLSGLVFHSIFEAWYNAPGSPEAMYYWVITGIILGLSTDPRLRSAKVPSRLA